MAVEKRFVALLAEKYVSDTSLGHADRTAAIALFKDAVEALPGSKLKSRIQSTKDAVFEELWTLIQSKYTTLTKSINVTAKDGWSSALSGIVGSEASNEQKMTSYNELLAANTLVWPYRQFTEDYQQASLNGLSLDHVVGWLQEQWRKLPITTPTSQNIALAHLEITLNVLSPHLPTASKTQANFVSQHLSHVIKAVHFRWSSSKVLHPSSAVVFPSYEDLVAALLSLKFDFALMAGSAEILTPFSSITTLLFGHSPEHIYDTVLQTSSDSLDQHHRSIASRVLTLLLSTPPSKLTSEIFIKYLLSCRKVTSLAAETHNTSTTLQKAALSLAPPVDFDSFMAEHNSKLATLVCGDSTQATTRNIYHSNDMLAEELMDLLSAARSTAAKQQQTLESQMSTGQDGESVPLFFTDTAGDDAVRLDADVLSDAGSESGANETDDIDVFATVADTLNTKHSENVPVESAPAILSTKPQKHRSREPIVVATAKRAKKGSM